MTATPPKGYRFAGIHAGIKDDRDRADLALIESSTPATAVGVFTTNKVRAAPVRVCQARLPSRQIRGVVVNSGNANACTGAAGLRDAEAMTAAAAARLGCEAEQFLVCSTGVIGRLLPMPAVLSGIDRAAAALESGPEAARRAALAIMTTDTVPKLASATLEIGDERVTVFGMCKGAAMIGPNMATMLAFLLTDVQADETHLAPLLRRAVEPSFHSISVEGHTSTNDTVLLLANGASGVRLSEELVPRFGEALEQVATQLARKIVDDAEGATHVICIDVQGAPSDHDARRIAKTIADSPLVKTAIYGHDPNWGRICSAVGYSGIDFEETDLSLSVNGTPLYVRGQPTTFDPARESARMKANRETLLEVQLSLGTGRCRFFTSDLTVDYVRLNADYTT